MKRKLFSIKGPEFANEEHGSAGLCSSKTSKSHQMDFTFQLLVTSGHCTVWQKPGHDAGQEHGKAPSSVVSMLKGSMVAMLHAVEKAFLVAQPIQLVALASPVACKLVI